VRVGKNNTARRRGTRLQSKPVKRTPRRVRARSSTSLGLKTANELQALEAALAEKEALLCELRHRIKNSLMVIASLVSLESDHAAERATRESLERVRNRVTSVAKLYELLSKSGEMNRVRVPEYLSQVITSVAGSFGPRNEAIVLDVRCDPVVLHVKNAAPLGLIVNELVTNAFKHGFSGRTQGTISVLLRREHGTVTLEVSDSGVGLPVDFTLERSDGLGLQIVQMLAAQLDATMEVVPSPATFRLMFKPSAENS